MKLLSCHIENFGKLSNLSLNFSDGINVINYENGWGKSTLAAFLKAMFYGLDSKKDVGAFQKERILYRPWQGGPYGGQLDFEVDGKKYRISRTFGATEKTDEFHVYDTRTNLEIFDFSEDIGEELFELDSASFRKSIFIAQSDCSSEASDGINAKLGNLAETSDDINNFENASKRMKDMLNQLTPDRVTGSIKRRKNYLTQLSQEVSALGAAQDGFEGISKKLAVVKDQIRELTDIRKSYGEALVVASEDSRRRELLKQYDLLCQDVEAKEQKKDALKVSFPQGVPTGKEFQEQLQNLQILKAKHASLQGMELTIEEHEAWGKLQEMFEDEVPTEKQIEASLETLLSAEKQKTELVGLETRLELAEKELKEEVETPIFEKGIGHKVFIGIGLVLIILSGIGLSLWYSELIPAFNAQTFVDPMILTGVLLGIVVLGAVLGLIGSVKGHSAAKRKEEWKKRTLLEQEQRQFQYDTIKAQANELKDCLNQIHGTIGTFLGRFHVYCKVDEYSAKLYELRSQLAEYGRLKQKLEATTKEHKDTEGLEVQLTVFAKKYQFNLGKDKGEALNLLQETALDYRAAESAYLEAVKKKEDFEVRQDKSLWTKVALCPYSIDELNQMIEQADQKLEELKETKTQYTSQLEELQEQLDLRDEKQAELDEQLALQDADTRKYQLLKVTHEFLQKAKEQFTAKYMEPIAKGFSKYYQMLTGDTSGNWIIDANINLMVREQGELRDTRWLSAGYQDLIGVCMRLALVDAMYTDEKPFLILDDPFVNLDKEKVEAGNQLLLSVSEEYQVIYFTCHDSRSPL